MIIAGSALIAGGGVGGLTAALALSRRGWAVTVLERRDRFEEAGAGVQLSPNAMHVLRALGVEDAVRAGAVAPDAAVIRDGQNGRVRVSAPLGATAEARYGAPYLNTHRADLHRTLLSACEAAGVSLRTGVTVTGHERHGERAAFLADERAAADLLVAADGIRSAVRARMLGEPPPRYTGHAAWRALVPSAAALDLPPDATSWTGRDRHAVTYRVRGGDAINLVAVTERAWTAEGWTRPGDPDELRAAFAGWDRRLTAVLDACEKAHLWGLFDRPPATRWTDGPVALLGDAAHPMLPFMAQGAAMAIEDAWVLAEEAEADAAHALTRYERRRMRRTRRIQGMANANADLFHGRGLGPLKLVVAGALPGLATRRFDSVYGTDVTSSRR